MKKLLAFPTLFFLLIGCEEPALDTSPLDEQIQEGKSFNPTSCTPMSGSGVYPKTGNYNCHEYVRAALTGNNLVDLATGEPDPVDFSYYSHTTIQADPNFIRVCSSSHAEAIAHLPQSKDHSALKVGTIYAYSYPGSGDIYRSASALNYGTACDYEYFASIEDISISGPVITGNQYKFTLQNKSNHSYITTDASRWSYDNTKFTEYGTTTDTQIILVPNSGVQGDFTVSATLNTSATDNPTGSCATGVNGIETATTYTPTRSNNFTVTPAVDCSGTLDGGSLYTFNYVTKFTQHNVAMNQGSWTWVKTSGSASWSTSNGGQNMSFTITSGSVTFNAYKSGCNRTITFYGY